MKALTRRRALKRLIERTRKVPCSGDASAARKPIRPVFRAPRKERSTEPRLKGSAIRIAVCGGSGMPYKRAVPSVIAGAGGAGGNPAETAGPLAGQSPGVPGFPRKSVRLPLSGLSGRAAVCYNKHIRARPEPGQERKDFEMEELSNLGVIRRLLDKHGFTFSKAMGQNFLINPSVCPRMARESGAGPGVGVIEIGAGIGVLTAQLARLAEKVVSIEVDSRLLPVLQETLGEYGNVKILSADVLKVDLARLIREEFPGMEVVVCANLPYYITSPILMKLLEERLPIRSITVMVQKEAARRLCARPGTRECGAVTVAVWYYSRPEILFPVSRGSFLPAPQVDSAVIRLRVLGTPAVAVREERIFFQVVRGAFSQRRKTLLNTLSSSLGLDKARTAELLTAAGVAPGLRAEQLALEQFASLADALWEFRRTDKNC